MSQILKRFSGARPWVFAAGQGAAFLGFHVLLRAAVL